MKRIILSVLILSVTLVISCKKEAKKSDTKVETQEVTSTEPSTDVTSMPEQKSETDESMTTEDVDEKNDVSKTIEEVKNEAITKVADKKAVAIKKVENVATKETEKVEEVVENTTKETTTVVEETQKEIKEEVKAEVKPIVKEEVTTPIKEVPKQLTQAETIARGKTLFTTGICKNCHNQTKKLIGPTLVNIGSVYKKKKGSIANFLKGNGKPIVEPKKFKMMKPNIDDVTRHMSTQDLEALEAYILSFAK